MHDTITSYTSPGISIKPISKNLFKSCFIWQFEDIPKETSGFYIIYSRIDIPLYVGESHDLQNRIKQHNDGRTKGEYRRIKKEIALHLKGGSTKNTDYAELKKYFYRVEYYECNSLDRRIYELFYMLKFETPFNKKPNIYCEFNGHNSFKYAKQYLEEHLEELVCSVDGDEVDLLFFIEEEAEFYKTDPVEIMIWKIHNAKFGNESDFRTFSRDISLKTKDLGVESIDGLPLETFLRKFIMDPANPKLRETLFIHGLDEFLNT
ncbi:GIY-YIG nuclease family protein [Neobacillus sp. BF23-41]|uniref:GIY-YIG nuclease family protein n=1 Tax=Neobacillus sp. BF23-41 TaxID=3240280 RepID=UPI0034E5A81F